MKSLSAGAAKSLIMLTRALLWIFIAGLWLVPPSMARAQDIIWLHQFGASGFDAADGMAVDDSGVYDGSTVPAALPGGAAVGDADAFVRKYDFDGIELWTRQFGSACLDLLSSVAIHASGVFVAGSTTGDAPFFPRCTNPPSPNNNFGSNASTFVRKLARDGTVLWTRQYGGKAAGPVGFTLAVDLAVDDAGVFVAGEAIRPRAHNGPGHSVCPIGPPEEDILVKRYDLAGNEDWSRQIGGTSQDTPSAIAANADAVYVGGVTLCQVAGGTNQGSADALVLKLGSQANRP